MFAVWKENEVVIHYAVASDSTDKGTVSKESETVKVDTGTHQGSVASPASSMYAFDYWTCDDGTEPISTDATFVPSKGSSGIYEEHTYYAHFKLNKATVTVHHYLKGTTIPVAEDTTSSEVIDTSYTAQPATTFLEGFTGYSLTANSYDPRQTVTIVAAGNTITIYYTLPLTIAAKTDSKTYDGSPLDGAYTISGELSTDTATITDALGTAPSITNVSESPKKYLTAAEQANITGIPSYYTVIYTPGTLTITKASLTITADSNSKVYDGTPLTDNGWQDTDPVGLKGTDAVKSVTVTGTITNVGTESNVPSAAVVKNGDVDVTANYEIEYVNGTLEISKRTVTLTSESGEKPYDGTALTKPTVTVGGDGFVEGEATEIKATGSVTTVAEGEVTNTIVYAEGTNFKADNYTITKNEGKLKITASSKALVIESSTKSWTYDGTTHTDEVYTVTYDGTAATADESGKVFTLSTGDTVTITATAEGVKDYDASYSENNTYTYVVSNAGSYSDVTANVGTLSINKRTVTLTSESGEKPYDGTALTKPTVTVGGDGFVEGEATEIKATGSVTTVAEGEVTNTIVYAEGTNFKADNYTITKNEGKLKITASSKALVIESSTKSWTYDGTTHTDEVYTVTYDGTAATADESGKVFTLSTGDTVTIAPDTYGVKDYDADYNANNRYTYTIKNGTTDATGNYSNITTTFGTLSILKREVTLTSASGSKWFDGTPLRVATVTVSGDGFVDGEGATYNVTGYRTEVGTSNNDFTYKLNENTKAKNYKITTVIGKLTILAELEKNAPQAGYLGVQFGECFE